MKHTSAASCRRAVTVTGVVQGVGFRPFVYRIAQAESLVGWVLNESGAVKIQVEGDPAALDRFLHALQNQPPPLAQIASVSLEELPPSATDEAAAGFTIRHSERTARAAPAVPPDIATCADCLRDIRDPDDRRFGYAFTNCTNCGPRWSIIDSVPYDRPNTSMRGFRMCAACRAEYEDPADRRFHAQPIACPACGPALQLLDAAGQPLAPTDDPIDEAAAAIRAGRIVAVKGIGGFQLVCDATQESAVGLLRQRKRRPDKPLALMAAAPEVARRFCRMSAEEEQAWLSPASPILLLRRRRESFIAGSVAPHNRWLGVMAPPSPMHHLLLARVGRPIVCTSGNLSDEPMAIDPSDAFERLRGVADAFLTHDRPIVRAVDDSVTRVDAGRLRNLRRARGYAPVPIPMALLSTASWPSERD